MQHKKRKMRAADGKGTEHRTGNGGGIRSLFRTPAIELKNQKPTPMPTPTNKKQNKTNAEARAKVANEKRTFAECEVESDGALTAGREEDKTARDASCDNSATTAATDLQGRTHVNNRTSIPSETGKPNQPMWDHTENLQTQMKKETHCHDCAAAEASVALSRPPEANAEAEAEAGGAASVAIVRDMTSKCSAC